MNSSGKGYQNSDVRCLICDVGFSDQTSHILYLTSYISHQPPIPKSRKSLIFVTFRGCSKNNEIKDFINQSFLTDHQSPITDYQLPTTDNPYRSL